VWVTVVTLLLLLNDECKLGALQEDGSRTRQEIPQTACCKARACNCCICLLVSILYYLPPLFVIRNFRSVVLKVFGITPLEAILRGKGAIKPKGEIGGNNTKGEKTLNH